jgi:hypothetical protein
MRRSVNIRASSPPAVSPVGVAAVGVLGAFSAGTAGALAASPPGGEYTLANALAGVPFTVDTPIAPTITSEATVSNSSELSANLVNGRRVTLQAGSYGNQTFNTTDQEFVFLPGADVGFVSIGANARRLIFRGSPARAGVMRYISTPFAGGPTDILFDGVTLDHADREWERSHLFQMQRLAIINSHVRALDQPLATFPSAYSGRLTDAIFGNNHFECIGTNASAVRFQIPLRLVFADNRVQNTVPGQSYHTFRIHGNQGQLDIVVDDCYVVRNQFEGPGHMIQRPIMAGLHTRIVNVWYENNANYGTLYQPINIGADADAYVEVFRIRNNALYQGGQSWPGQVLPAWTVSGNTAQTYQTPPIWEYL